MSLSWRRKSLATDLPCSNPPDLELGAGAGLSTGLWQPSSQGSTCGGDPRPRPLAGWIPTPGGGGELKQPEPAPTLGLANQTLRSQTSGYAPRRVRGGAEVPAPSFGVWVGRRGPRRQRGRAGGLRRPAPLARVAMQGPAGNTSRALPGGPPSTVASGAGRCESGALMHSFGIFLQGLLGVVAFSTLLRESGTPAPPQTLRREPRVQPGLGGVPA